MNSELSSTKTTIWIWPSGLFPRRLIFYFRAKGITLSVLKEHNIELVPVELTTCPPALRSMPGHERRPADSSLPILRIEYHNGRTIWIRESLSIIEYLEEQFSTSHGFRDLRGRTAEQHAQARDVIGLLNDATHWSLVALIHSDPTTTYFSGLSREEMSSTTAEHAKKKFSSYLERLEQWLLGDDGEGMMGATVSGVVLLAQVEYFEMMYGSDWVHGHGVLRAWVNRMKEEEWFVGNEELKSVERGEGWELLLGGGSQEGM
ncbi:hypothetical protein EKO04_001067 [Ascochyta lentis]|uniref:Glutathione S-transferase n=1 Tax=Ascochyta lentis TaxID=205686 RepID=A0A8H7JDZ3_9PLEO|nr:hypothetical protein EKO04_001067 [Ascochyta lentis]